MASTPVVGPESVAVIERVELGLALVVDKVPITVKDSFE